MTCSHNAMVRTGEPSHAWRCADCGYVYGSSVQVVPSVNGRTWDVNVDGVLFEGGFFSRSVAHECAVRIRTRRALVLGLGA